MAIPWAAFSEGRPAEDSVWTFGSFRYDYMGLYEIKGLRRISWKKSRM
jgi:hypothetical protein